MRVLSGRTATVARTFLQSLTGSVSDIMAGIYLFLVLAAVPGTVKCVLALFGKVMIMMIMMMMMMIMMILGERIKAPGSYWYTLWSWLSHRPLPKFR